MLKFLGQNNQTCNCKCFISLPVPFSQCLSHKGRHLPHKNSRPTSAPSLARHLMTHLAGVIRDSVAPHHNYESSTLCQIRPLKRVTTVYCPRLPFYDQRLCAFVFQISRVDSDGGSAEADIKLRLPLLLRVNTRLSQMLASS